MMVQGGIHQISSLLCCILTYFYVQAGPVVRPSRMVREIYPEVEQDIPDSSQSQACIVGDVLYPPGTPIPSDSPCLKCSCVWGEVRCEAEVCSLARGCRAVALPGRCCPAYECECLHQGKTYANGERLPQAPGHECSVCYCRGGHVQCAEVGCYTRSDCEPKYVPGECCPKYDHCPPRDSLSDRITGASAPSLQSLDTDFLNPWPSAKDNSSTVIVSSVSSEEGSGDDDIAMGDEPKRISTPVTFSIKEIESKGNGKKTDDGTQIIKVDQSAPIDPINHPQITIQEITPPRSEFIPPQAVSISPLNPTTYKPFNLPEILNPTKTQDNNTSTTRKIDSQTTPISSTADDDPNLSSSTLTSIQTESTHELMDTEASASEKTEVYVHPPPVLRIGDQLLFIKQGQLVPENGVSPPSPVITLIGAEGLQIGVGSGEGIDHDILSVKSEEISSTSESSNSESTEKSSESISTSDEISTLIPRIKIVSSEETSEISETPSDTSAEFITVISPAEKTVTEMSSTVKPSIENSEYIPEENPYYPPIPEDIMIFRQDEHTTDDTSESSIKNIPSRKSEIIVSSPEEIDSEKVGTAENDSDDITVIPLSTKKTESNLTKILPHVLELRNNSTITNQSNHGWLKNEPTKISIPLINENAALPESILKMAAASDFNTENYEETTITIPPSTISSDTNTISFDTNTISLELTTVSSVTSPPQVGTANTTSMEILTTSKSDKIVAVVEKFVDVDISKETLELNEEINESGEFTTVLPNHSSLLSNEDASVEVIQNDSASADTSSLVEIIPGFEKVTEKIPVKPTDYHSKTVEGSSPKDEVEMINISGVKIGNSHAELKNSHEEKQKRDVVKKVLKDTFENPKENIRTDLEDTTNLSIELFAQNEEQNIVKPNDLFTRNLNTTITKFESTTVQSRQSNLENSSRHQNSKVAD